MYVSVNNKISSYKEAVIPADDRGFLYGDMVFDTIVAFSGQLVDAVLHIERLRHATLQLGINLPWSNEELVFEMNDLVSRIPAPRVALRIYVSSGQGFGLARTKQPPNKIIYASEDIFKTHDVNQGIKIQTSSVVNPARSSGIKSNYYMPEIVALEKAKKEEFDDVLAYNQQGELTECLSSNIFFLSRQGDQYSFDTPALQSGLFAGIMRQNVIKMFQLATIPYQERSIYREEIPRFDEAFTCSTLRGLMPIVMIDRHRLQTLRKNAAFWHVKRLFDSVVENKIGFRVNWQTGEKTIKEEVSEKTSKEDFSVKTKKSLN